MVDLEKQDDQDAMADVKAILTVLCIVVVTIAFFLSNV